MARKEILVPILRPEARQLIGIVGLDQHRGSREDRVLAAGAYRQHVAAHHTLVILGTVGDAEAENTRFPCQHKESLIDQKRIAVVLRLVLSPFRRPMLE